MNKASPEPAQDSLRLVEAEATRPPRPSWIDSLPRRASPSLAPSLSAMRRTA